jgi:HTH-type transcriptional regulator/antitoxin HipB
MRNIIMKKKQNKNITTLDEILDAKYGKRGVEKRESWEQEFESFRLDVMREEVQGKS